MAQVILSGRLVIVTRSISEAGPFYSPPPGRPMRVRVTGPPDDRTGGRAVGRFWPGPGDQDP